MNKSELLNWLEKQYQNWEALLDQIGLDHIDQPGVNGDWSMKDMVAPLNGWNRRLVASLQAVQNGEPEPPSPWPAQLQSDDEINAWIYESNHGRPVSQVLDELHHVFQQLFAVVKEFPEDVQIDTVQQGGREYYLVRLNEKLLQPGEFFDHFYDDHEPDVRAWLRRIREQ